MRMLAAVEKLPSGKGIRDRWLEVWERVLALPKGKWLPVELKNMKETSSIYIGARVRRTPPKLESRRRGLTVYLRVKP
jgi:hypothetical protein